MPMKLRNKKKAFAAMALVALATPQATAIADSDSVNLGSNPGPPARQSCLRGDISRCVRTRDISAGEAGTPQSLVAIFWRQRTRGSVFRAPARQATWHIAYTSPNLPGIQAAVSVGLGVSILPDVAILSDHRVLKPTEGFPSVTNTEIALVVAADASPATRRLAEVLAEFCSSTDPHPIVHG
jgi:DNA-binding transcriptional LysR family regulator